MSLTQTVRPIVGVSQQPHALVVEDSPEFRDLIAAQLKAAGFQVAAVADGTSAVEAARSQPFDVIVLDLGLPGIDGVEVCRQRWPW